MRKMYSFSLYLDKDIFNQKWEIGSTKLVHHHRYQQDPTVELISERKGKLEVFLWQWIICTMWTYPNSSKCAPELEEKGERRRMIRVLKHFPLLFLYKCYIKLTFSYIKIWKIMNHNNNMYICICIIINKASWDLFPHSLDISLIGESKQHFTAPAESKLVFLATKCSVYSTVHIHTHIAAYSTNRSCLKCKAKEPEGFNARIKTAL